MNGFENHTHTITKKKFYKHDRQFFFFIRFHRFRLMRSTCYKSMAIVCYFVTVIKHSSNSFASRSYHFHFVILCNCAIVSCDRENYVERPIMDEMCLFFLFLHHFPICISYLNCQVAKVHKIQIEINISFQRQDFSVRKHK